MSRRLIQNMTAFFLNAVVFLKNAVMFLKKMVMFLEKMVIRCLPSWEGGNGNPVKVFELPKSLYGFTLDGNSIYGLSREESPKVYVLELEL